MGWQEKREKEAKCRRVVLRMLRKLTAGWGAWIGIFAPKVCCSALAHDGSNAAW